MSASHQSHTRVVAAFPVLLVKVMKSLARGTWKGRHSCRCRRQRSKLLFFLFRAMRKPSQPLLGHGQSGLQEEAESRSCPTSVHTPDPEPPPPPLTVGGASSRTSLGPLRQFQLQIVIADPANFKFKLFAAVNGNSLSTASNWPTSNVKVQERSC